MGLLRSVLTFPVAAPIKGSLWVARKVHEAADTELNSPAALKRQLAALEAELLAGRITEDEYDEVEADLLTRLLERG